MHHLVAVALARAHHKRALEEIRIRVSWGELPLLHRQEQRVSVRWLDSVSSLLTKEPPATPLSSFFHTCAACQRFLSSIRASLQHWPSPLDRCSLGEQQKQSRPWRQGLGRIA